MVKGDPVGDLDTPMREFMEWDDVPRVLIEKTGYTIGERSWTATAFICLYSSMRDIQKSGTLSLWRRCKHTAKTRSF